MPGVKALSFLEKRELECSICLERYKNPMTLKCLHSYCLQCLVNLTETQGRLRCPKCCDTYEDLKKEDLNNLTPNTMIRDLVDYVEKIESEKPPNCKTCDNKPKIFCSDCQLYLCGDCIKHHKVIPALKDHSLYTLDKTDELRDNKICQTHCENVEFFCQTCNKIGCKKCEHVLSCYQNGHDVVPIKIAVDDFNKMVLEITQTINAIKDKLKIILDNSNKDSLKFESQLKLCRTAIEIQEKQIIKKVQEKTKKLMDNLEEIYKDNKKSVEEKVKNIDSKLICVNQISLAVNTLINKPEETETLRFHEATINAVKEEVLGAEFDKLTTKRSIKPTYISNTHLYNVIKTEDIGIITNADCVYKITEDDKSITVTKGQTFVVKVYGTTENKAYQLAGTLINTSGEESAIKVKYQGNGEYKIKCKCNMEGVWKLKITDRVAHITGSPVNIKVEELGLVKTTENIETYTKVMDIMLDVDGCILVSSCSKDILKFNQSGVFVGKIETPKYAQIICMHQMDDGCKVACCYDDDLEETRCAVLFDENFQEIRTFGKGILKSPAGLTVNETTRILYVADQDLCVFKFDVDDGRLLGETGSHGSEEGQMRLPTDVTLTMDGHVIVADCNNRIQMFDANDNFMKIIVGSGDGDGHVVSPFSVITDDEENILVSSNHKLQLFDKNGVFIKRIDKDDDGINDPAGIAVISHRPRRVAVANYGENNVKIFNY